MSSEQIFERLGSLEAKVDILLNREAKTTSIDRRVRRLENYRHKLMGIAAAVSFGVTLLGLAIKAWVSK